uniref:Cyclic nucleotide-binding domain-containing protein n=1 Tax=Cryptomonas curvata TaxID=233186 RepID=A0A7S0QNR9_9CRYP
MLKSGACFGEVSLLIDTKRMATCRAMDYCELYALTRADLEELLDRFPENRFSVAASALAPLLRSDTVCPALRGISEEDAERLARRMAQQPVEIIDGAVLCDSRTGNPPVSAFLIKSGQVAAEGPDETPEPVLDMEDLRCVGLVELLAGVAPLHTVRE